MKKPKPESKPVMAWAIKCPDGSMDLCYVRDTRQLTIDSFDKSFWDIARKEGYRCLRVKIIEVGK